MFFLIFFLFGCRSSSVHWCCCLYWEKLPELPSEWRVQSHQLGSTAEDTGPQVACGTSDGDAADTTEHPRGMMHADANLISFDFHKQTFSYICVCWVLYTHGWVGVCPSQTATQKKTPHTLLATERCNLVITCVACYTQCWFVFHRLPKGRRRPVCCWRPRSYVELRIGNNACLRPCLPVSHPVQLTSCGFLCYHLLCHNHCEKPWGHRHKPTNH